MILKNIRKLPRILKSPGLLMVLFQAIVLMLNAQTGTISNMLKEEKEPELKILSHSDDRIVVKFVLGSYLMEQINIDGDSWFSVSLPGGVPLLEHGAPDLPCFTGSFALEATSEMSVEISAMKSKLIKEIWIAPSKGNLTRDIDPSTVQYIFGKSYQEDKYFPDCPVSLRDPYIIRDIRGQTMVITPFQYNPVRKELRIIEEMTVVYKKTGDHGFNPLVINKSDKIDREFYEIYINHFLNFDELQFDYNPLAEEGNMLIISYGSYISALNSFVEWKTLKGTPVEVVNVSSIGSSAAIKNFITNYYNTVGVTFVLLVGDHAHVPASSTSAGPSDVNYSYVAGNDHYPDLFIGRFSAESVSHVETQVQRTVDYEKNPLVNNWLKNSIGIASSQGPGDDNEYDYQHIRNLQTKLLNFTYSGNVELFDGSQGGNDAAGNPTATMVSQQVNAGAGIILYTGHGSNTSWGTSGFSNTHVNSLTNFQKLPFIWDVACVNGNFTGITCFAEAWLRAVNNSQPAGAVAMLASTINQSWNPPMEGQDEMVAILVESYVNNIKRTFGGLSYNGCMKMNDKYGTSGYEMTDTWTCFGDPSLMVRTDIPSAMLVSHETTVSIGTEFLDISCNTENALAALSFNGNILGTATIVNGQATIQFAPLTQAGTLKLCLTAFNKIPSISEIEVASNPNPVLTITEVSINDPGGNNNGLFDWGETVSLNLTLENTGGSPASDLSVTISTNDEYITITDSSASIEDVLPGSSSTLTELFDIQSSIIIPDGRNVSFQILISGNGIWIENIEIQAHAPSFELLEFHINDEGSGNGNHTLDAGETAGLLLTIINSGSSEASQCSGLLLSENENITILQPEILIPVISPGETCELVFSVSAGSDVAVGEVIDHVLQVSFDDVTLISFDFSLIIGQPPVLIIDLDVNHSSGSVIGSQLDLLDIAYDMVISFPQEVDRYSTLIVCLGIYPDNYVLSAAEGQILAGFLTDGGNIWMEGGDTWFYDPPTAVHQMFGITGLDDGAGDLSVISGLSGSFAEGYTYNYIGENYYIDRLQPFGNAENIFENSSPNYYCAVANVAQNYQTLGTSFEFGGLSEIRSGSSTELVRQICVFFGLIPGFEYTQMIMIPQGWSGISTCIVPVSPDIEVMLQEISDNLVILQDEQLVYWPGQGINTIGEWNQQKGYRIKLNAPEILMVNGDLPDSQSYDLSPGWQILPVLSQCEVPIEEVVSPETGITIIKELAGNALYWPEYGIHTLDVLQPGRAYLLFAEEYAFVVFPYCE